MTSGQYSPLTPQGSYATTAPYGMVERPFDLCNLVIGAGGTFTARSTTYHARHLTNMIKEAVQHKGFAFVDALSQCPTYFGRRNKLRTPLDMMNWFKERSVMKGSWEKMSPEDREGKFPIGVLAKGEAPELTEIYAELIDKIQQRGEEQ